MTNEALNQIVNAAQAHPACYGARMAGAGFGGCAVALVKRESPSRMTQVEAFVEATEKAYQAVSGLNPAIYVCRPGEGAGVVTQSSDPHPGHLPERERGIHTQNCGKCSL